MTLARGIAVFLAIGTLAGCSTVAPPKVTVTLGLYSGRADPTWDLSEARAGEVVAEISALPVVTGIPPQGGLGYHGFVLLLRRAGQPDATIVVYRGTVAPIEGAPGSYRIDAGRTLERLLLESGRELLAPLEIATIESDLAGAP